MKVPLGEPFFLGSEDLPMDKVGRGAPINMSGAPFIAPDPFFWPNFTTYISHYHVRDLNNNLYYLLILFHLLPKNTFLYHNKLKLNEQNIEP